jgi:putative RNA 2'-phosphotransferase
MNVRRKKKVSKYLSKLLRHDPGRLGLSLGPGGWINVRELLDAFERHGVEITREEVLEAVLEGEKPRFSLQLIGGGEHSVETSPGVASSDGSSSGGDEEEARRRALHRADPARLRIRAAYGHSIPLDLGLNPQEPPELLYHGTAEQTVEHVLYEGLKAMGRQFVHLYEEPGGALEVGQRHGRPVLLAVRSGEMHGAGLSFYPAGGGIWLTERVPKEYLRLST